MSQRLFVIAALVAALTGCSRPELATFREILDRQATAWNRGDIDAFMGDYWKSEELSFSSGGETTYGWQATYDRYRTRYDSPEKMGRLTFDGLACRALGPEAALVRGNWQLVRPVGDVGGNFSLVFQRIDGRWVIIHDHTSVRPAAGD